MKEEIYILTFSCPSTCTCVAAALIENLLIIDNIYINLLYFFFYFLYFSYFTFPKLHQQQVEDLAPLAKTCVVVMYSPKNKNKNACMTKEVFHK